MKKYKTNQDRITANVKIDGNGCWIWQLSLNKKGKFAYGYIGLGAVKNNTRINVAAHRFSYSAFKGEIPDGINVCHSCDNPKCVNPEHLFLGTRQDNVDDRESKNRNNPYYKKGCKHPNAIITESNVVTIIDMQSKGLKSKDIAKEIGVNVRIIYDVISGRTWGHFTKNLNQLKQSV